MPQIPVIVPLIVSGVLLGSMWSHQNPAKAWRKALLAAILAGFLNAAYVWLLAFLRASNIDVSGNSGLVLMASSCLSGFVVVITVFLSVAGVVRYRRGRELEQEE